MSRQVDTRNPCDCLTAAWRGVQSIAHGIGPKPGKMRHATFERILAEYDKHLRRVLALTARRFNLGL